MRVITGKARGVQLKTPDGMTTRPTSDRVKEACFSIIQFDIPGQAAVSEAPVPRKGIGRLVLIAGLELLGILGLGAYWALVLLR